MVEELGIDLHQMMENAGHAVAQHARAHLLAGDASGRRVVVMAGGGGNGGGGIVAARRLSIWGARVSIVLGQPEAQMGDVPAHQLMVAKRLGIPVHPPHDLPQLDLEGADAVIDALIGYSLQGPPRQPVRALIDAVNRSGSPVASVDIPSGLDADSGTAPGAAVRATTTLTLALPKRGLRQPGARQYVGALYVADISVPALAYEHLGLSVAPIFARSGIVAIPDL